MYKTPGVFIEEIATFPPSVVPVETAIPAFVGYTEKAVDDDGNNLGFVPTRIRSLLEYEQFFGTDYVPDNYRVTLDTTSNNTVTAVVARNSSDVARRYYMYSTLRHFYANGGGACYIVSVGSYSDDPDIGDTTTPAGLLGGLSRLERYDEPTILLFPDGVSLSSVSDLGSVQMAALAQCAKLQDRFTVMDIMNGDKASSISLDPFEEFRNNNGTSNLKYGAAYYPWLKTVYKPQMKFNQLEFFNQSDAAISDSDINDIDALVSDTRFANSNIDSIISSIDLTALTGVTLTRDNVLSLMDIFKSLVDDIRQTPASPVGPVREALERLFILPRAIALSFPVLDAASLGDEVDQIISDMSEVNSTVIQAIVNLIEFEKVPTVMSTFPSVPAPVPSDPDIPRDTAMVSADYSALDGLSWIQVDSSNYAATTDIGALSIPAYTGTTYERAMHISADLEEHMSSLATAYLSLLDSATYLADEAEKKLFTTQPVFISIAEQINKIMGILPASGAVAGIYASVDRGRGVWKAPANVSVADVVGPAVKINDETQGNLNVHSTGKSINAIRAFTGKGTIIWGARTLDGNSNEWRYIPVRRFFNMAEESIKKATEPFTFEPNDANTWVRVRAMVENFLTIQWRNGALAGATTAQAYYVKVGLGETMTSQDILEGRMIIEIGMAVVRPAEFIILKFSHKMQVS